MTLLWAARRRATDELLRAQLVEGDLRRAWRAACEGSGLCRTSDSVVGSSVRTPAIRSVTAGPPVALVVELLPGQLPADVEAVALRLAPALGVARLRVTSTSDMFVRVELLDEDPLNATVSLPPVPPDQSTFLGQDEAGRPVRGLWADLTHAVVQGTTGSGKSSWTYATLVQAAGNPDMLVAGCDPSGLFWRPFTGSRHADWQVSGLRSVQAHAELLARLVDEMDSRTEAMPDSQDSVTTSRALPLILVVLEEYAGLLRAADQADTKIGKAIRGHVARLLAEGRKAGIRVLIIVQRAEAAIIGALERAQCALRISFRTDNRASVELLHPGAPSDVAEEHATALPGVALVTMPGRRLLRLRAPHVTYPEYVARVGRAGT